MASFETPKTWVPNGNIKDCSQGFCSLYCPQWCYIIFPPPPPPPLEEFPDIIDNSNPTFSPLLIAIIGILVSAFLLVCYYTIISKYCGNTSRNIESESIRRTRENQQQEVEDDDIENPYEPWQICSTGLDDAVIKRITMFKYKKGDCLIESNDCSVCLNEFEEDECLRLLPKCSHAFHVNCIDTWLKSHSNCPLCRANIVFVTTTSPLPPPLPTPPQEGPPSVVGGGSDADIMQNVLDSPKQDAVIETRDEEGQLKRVRRSFSMDHPRFQSRASIADMLRINDDDDDNEYLSSEEGRSSSVEVNKSGRRRKRRGVSMKRTFSSGRFLVPGRVRDTVSICIV